MTPEGIRIPLSTDLHLVDLLALCLPSLSITARSCRVPMDRPSNRPSSIPTVWHPSRRVGGRRTFKLNRSPWHPLFTGSGKRKALLIGINYIGTSSALSGCSGYHYVLALSIVAR